jgi:hypothetical protein
MRATFENLTAYSNNAIFSSKVKENLVFRFSISSHILPLLILKPKSKNKNSKKQQNNRAGTASHPKKYVRSEAEDNTKSASPPNTTLPNARPHKK